MKGNPYLEDLKTSQRDENSENVDDQALANSYIQDFKAKEKTRTGNRVEHQKKTNSHYSEDDIKEIVRLRFGSEDMTKTPIRSWREIATLIGAKSMSIFSAVKRY
jgi:hypothetical protein